jgi:hypothetical protein
MPKGHELLTPDPEAEAAFAGQYGIHPNAEALLNAHRANVDPALEAALLKPVDEEATADLDPSEIEPAKGGTVQTAVVRGGVIVYVAEGEDGRLYKGVQAEGHEPPSGDADAAVSQAAATVNANIEKKVAEYRAELNEAAAEAMAGVREEAEAKVVEAAEAEAAAAEGEAPKARSRKKADESE